MNIYEFNKSNKVFFHHKNDKDIKKLPIDDKGNETYFIKNKKVNYRVTSLASPYFPFDKVLTSKLILCKTKNPSSKYYDIVYNTRFSDTEKIPQLIKKFSGAAQIGTNVHLMPELYITNEATIYHNTRDLPTLSKLHETLKIIQKYVNDQPEDERFVIKPYHKSFQQFYSFSKDFESKGWKWFNPEWKIWLNVVTKAGKIIRIGGTMDAPAIKILPNGKILIRIVDWKHIPKVKKNSRVSVWPDFLQKDLGNQTLYTIEVQYSLQLHIYKYILEQNYKNSSFNFDNITLQIVCLHEDNTGPVFYEPLDLSNSVKNLFQLIKDEKFEESIEKYKRVWAKINPLLWVNASYERRQRMHHSRTYNKKRKRKSKTNTPSKKVKSLEYNFF